MKKTFSLLIMFLLAAGTLTAQTINFYPPIPQTDRDSSSNKSNPPAVVPVPMNRTSALWSGPTAMATANTFFLPDAEPGLGAVTSDSITVPGNISETGAAVGIEGFPDSAIYWSQFFTTKHPGIIYPTYPSGYTPSPARITRDIVQANAMHIFDYQASTAFQGGAQSCGSATGNGSQSCFRDIECFSLCLTGAFTDYQTNFPASLLTNENPIRITDGEQDLGDFFLTDVAPTGDELVAEFIPDPLDSFFPTYSKTLKLTAPVDVDMIQSVDSSSKQAVILNRFPLQDEVSSVIKDQPNLFYLTWPVLPYPLMYADPLLQNKGGHLFAIASDFGDGPVPPEAETGPKFTYNDDNECMTQEGGVSDWAHPKMTDPRNCLSQPTAIRALPIFGTDRDDIVVLHQRINHPLVPNTAPAAVCQIEAYLPTWRDYFTNFDKTQNQFPDLKTTDSPLKIYNAVNIGLTGLAGSLGTGVTFTSFGAQIGFGIDLAQPVDNTISSTMFNNIPNGISSAFNWLFTNQGYLTTYKNNHSAGDSPDASKFDVVKTVAGTRSRYGVGQVPSDMAVADVDNNAATPDLLIVDYGAIDLVGLGQLLGSVLPLGGQSFDGNVLYGFDSAGGFMAVENFGEDSTTHEVHAKNGMYYYPIRPDQFRHSDPVHPVHISTSHVPHGCDFNGDKKDDAAVTFFDGMGMSLDATITSQYQIPDIISSPQSFADPLLRAGPQGWKSGTVCNNAPLTSTDPSDCANGDPSQAYPGGTSNVADDPANPFVATYELPDSGLNEFKCKRIEDGKEKNLDAAYPAGPDQLWSDDQSDLWECQGAASNPACPALKRENASQFVYHVVLGGYKAQDGTWAATVSSTTQTVATGSMPLAWQPMGCSEDASTHKITCAHPPTGFEIWSCETKAMPFQGGGTSGIPTLIITCSGKTVLASDASFPRSIPNFLAHQTGSEMWVDMAPVERDMIFDCGLKFGINRDSEFAVYMNDGNGGFLTPEAHHNYVQVAFDGMEKIVPSIPFNKKADIVPPMSMNRTDDRMSMESSGAVKGTVGTGPWPYSVACADMVDSNGSPFPDGNADIVVGMNNSHQVCLFPSQASQDPKKQNKMNPFTNTKMICFDSSTTDYKNKLAAYLKDANDDLAKDPVGGLFLTPQDYLKFGIGLASGTSFVDIPKDSINGLDDMNGDVETRRGITAIHGFPWKDAYTIMNSVFGTQAFNMMEPKTWAWIGDFFQHGCLGGLLNGNGASKITVKTYTP
jgi:hypothetical protein